ncbi:TPA: hypothetical protein I9140_001014 [Clostridium perfringens]|nr:hypothetical protein [Clostridium perfringens]
MFKVSEGFKKEINKLQGRKFNAKVIIRDKEYSGNQIYEMNLEESVNSSDNFSIGTVCSNTFEIKLINTGDIFDNAIVKPYVGLYIGEDIEYIPLGVFNVIKTSVKGKFINLECVDNMLGLEKVYFSNLSYPADINDIAKEICKKAGVNLASKLPNYRVNKIEGYSLREAIGFIASLCGSFARFNRIGDLEIRGYEVVKQEMTPHNLFKLDIEANECIIKKVIAKKGEEELSTGTDDGNKIVFNNPIITKEILSDIYTKYNGFKYIPYTAKWKGNPAIMAGDILNLTDLKGNKYNALIMEQKFTYKNGISSEVKAKGKTRQDSSFDSKGSVTQSMERYSIEQANIKKALIDKASINDLTAVDAKIQRLYTEDLTAIRAEIVNLNSKKANILELNSLKATLQQAIIMKADITDLNAAVGKINVLESKTASIDNLLAGNLTADNFKANSIVAGSGIIAEGAIGSAQISSLSVNKLEAGEFITSKHKIVSVDGTIEIVGNQILINRNNINRVVLGEYRKKDGTTEYGLLVRAKDGQTIMLDGNGVHNAGITDGAIDNNKVADNANISGNKLDINSVIREVNNNGTETIKGTKVTVWDRTLDVELSTQKNTITEHGKELSSQKATIQALDSAIKLKVDSQTFTQSTQTINSNINRAKEQAIIGARSIPDTRNDNQSPGWYIEHYPFQSITEFKYSNVIQIPNGGYQYGTLETKVPWNNSSGGYPTQVFRSNSFPTYQRHGINETTWSSWEQIEDTQGSQAKANSALSNAKAFVNAEITTVNSHLNKATAEINVLKEKIESKVSQADIDKSIQEIKIGGRNLALNSSRFELPARNTGTASDNYNYISIDANLLLNSEYTISANVEIVSGSIKEISIYDYPGGKCSRVPIINNRITYTFTKRSNTVNSVLLYAGLAGETRGNSVIFTNVMLEKGNMVSDWSPAPEDTDKLIIDNIKTVTDKISTVESKFTQENNSIKASVQDLNSTTQTITTNVSNINRDLTSKINSNLDAAKNFATDIAIAKANLAKEQAIASADGKITAEEQKRIQQAQANLNTAIAKATEAETKAKSYADVKKQEAINSANNNTNNAINNIKIGGRNYGLNTDVMQQEPYNIIFSKDLVFEKGKTYTISMDFDLENLVKGSQERVGCEGSILFKDGTRQYIGVWHWISQGATFKGRKSYTFTIENKDIKDNMTSIHIYTELVSSGKRNLGRFKIEEGNKATDYTIAPEDLQSYADKVAKAKADLAQANAIANADGKITEEERKRIQQAQENLNTAIARADKAKQDAINTASTDATNKANNALNSAKAFVNAEITTVNNKVHNVESNLNILKDQIKSKVSQSDIDKSISNITIGGRNLALGTSLNYSNPYSGFDGGINKCPSVAKVITDGLKVGDIVKVRLLYKYENIVQASGKTNSAWLQGAGDVTGWGSGAFSGSVRLNNFSGNGTYEFLYSFTVTKEHMKNNYWDVNLRHDYILSGSVCWKMFKVEKGNKATDWTPAPEDINSLIVDNIKVVDTKISDVSSSVTQLRDSVTTQINSINSKTNSIETTLNGKASKQEVTAVDSKITTIKADLSSITQRVSSAEVKTNKLNDNIQSLSSRMASAEQKITPTAIINTVSSTIDTRINNIEIGGRNYILNSNFINLTPGSSAINKWKVWGDISVFGRQGQENYNENGVAYLGALKGGGIWQELSSKLIKKDTEYTLSLLVGQEGNVKKSDCYIEYWNGNSKIKTVQIFSFSGGLSLERRSFKFRTITNNFTEIRLVLNHEGASTTAAYLLQVGLIKLEEGKFNTAWTPAPEDVTQEFSEMKANFSVTINGINSEVSKKVNFNEIISRINQSAEGVKIDANKVDLNGYVTIKNLGTPGATIIDGRNIKTGFIEAIQLIAPHITGKTQMYLERGSILSSDGEANFRKFYGMPGGTFNVESEATFGSTVNATRFRCNGNYVPFSRSGYKWVVESLQGIDTPNGDAIEFQMVGGTKFGVNIWYSDARLKTDIAPINPLRDISTSTNKIGLELIKAINHYKFRYKSNPTKKIECGYVAQDLQRHNKQIVNSIKQSDGTEILQVDERTIIPNLSLAIQEQQKIIEKLERRIEEIERIEICMKN